MIMILIPCPQSTFISLLRLDFSRGRSQPFPIPARVHHPPSPACRFTLGTWHFPEGPMMDRLLICPFVAPCPQDPPSLVWAYHAVSFLSLVLGDSLLLLLCAGTELFSLLYQNQPENLLYWDQIIEREKDHGVLRRESQNWTVRSQLCAMGRWSICSWGLGPWIRS
jgi:hypothetical protein